jgi:hypothetical protein
VRRLALRRLWKGAKGDAWSRQGDGCGFYPSRMPTGRAATKAERCRRGSPPAYRRTGGGWRRKGGVSIKPQECPGAESGLFLNFLGWSPARAKARRCSVSPSGAHYVSFWLLGQVYGGIMDFGPLGQLGRAHWATFGPVTLSAIKGPSNS